MALIKLNTRSIPDDAVTPDKVSQNLGRRNLIINGAMQVAQRGTSHSGIGGGGYYSLDRWQYQEGGGATPEYNFTQDTDAPVGYSKSLKIECAVADTSLGGGSYSQIGHAFEGQNLQVLEKGTSSAKKTTLSFWVKGNLLGTYAMTLWQADQSRQNTKSFTINQTGVWEHKTITYDGDTTGTIANTSAEGLSLKIMLHAGSQYTGGSEGVSSHSTTTNYAANHNVNFSSSTSNYIKFTGVQLEVGDTATAFEHRSYGDELLACKRYFQRIAGGESGITVSAIMNAQMHNSTFVEGIYKMEVEMRTEPSLECVTGTDYYGFSRNGALDTFNSISIDSGAGSPRQVNLYNNSQVSGTAGQSGIMFSRVEAAIVSLSAEL